MLRNSLLFLLVAVASWALAQWQPRESITLCGGLGPVAEAALTAEGAVVRREGALLILEIDDREGAVRGLGRAMLSLQIQKDVIANNLANADTTITAEGTPYRRQHVVFDSFGGVLGVEEDRGDPNWVYDPGHPDAQILGVHRGYVARPNVNTSQEAKCWAQCEAEQQAVRLVLQRLHPDLIFSPAQTATTAAAAIPDQHSPPALTSWGSTH